MFGDVLYNLFIMPLEMIIEFIFSVAYKISQNPGLSIICVSLAVNFLALPLYRRADKIQSAERDKQAAMKPWLDHIKQTFTGDKRYMMTQAYYREQDYKPIYVLKSSLSLLLQIPFFTAAYHFLSNLELLQEASFWIFPNLGQPDGLIHIGSITLNLLPILMTAINIISGAIYTRGFALKDKLQLYAVALIFLVLLYNSPSGLVFYWTLNNVFSLLKNVVMKLIPIPKREHKKESKLIDKKVFFVVAGVLAVFTGLYIPLSIVSASPTEFIGENYSPLWLVINTFSVMTGFFLVWLSVFYYLGNNKVKNIFIFIVWGLLGIGIVSFFIYGNEYGNMSNMLVYSNGLAITDVTSKLINLVVCILTAAAFVFVIYKWPKIIRKVSAVLLLTGIGLSVVNIIQVQSSVNEVSNKNDKVEVSDSVIPLSKNGQNVMVIMLDRAISSYLPTILEEKPELADSLSGFTYYPNTVSFGQTTNFSVPSLFGGYDYTPSAINSRTSETLKDKHNESISVLPEIFSKEKYKLTMIDIPYAGSYLPLPDLTFYDKYENSDSYYLKGTYSDNIECEDHEKTKATIEHNMIYQCVFRCAPQYLKTRIYDNGEYFLFDADQKLDRAFIDSYSTLTMLPEITNTTSSENTFLMMENSTPHEPTILSTPDYEPVAGLSKEYTLDGTYMVNMASIMQLCKWFDYMKQEGVYDNTKIIVCSDHGFWIDGYIWNFDGDKPCIPRCNPLLMVKDFNSNGFTTNDEFMTLADIPALVTDGVIDNPVNPFTGNAIDMSGKEGGVDITGSALWDTNTNNGNTFDTSDANWYHVKDNIFDENNWKVVEGN